MDDDDAAARGSPGTGTVVAIRSDDAATNRHGWEGSPGIEGKVWGVVSAPVPEYVGQSSGAKYSAVAGEVLTLLQQLAGYITAGRAALREDFRARAQAEAAAETVAAAARAWSWRANIGGGGGDEIGDFGGFGDLGDFGGDVKAAAAAVAAVLRDASEAEQIAALRNMSAAERAAVITALDPEVQLAALRNMSAAERAAVMAKLGPEVRR